MGHHPSDDPSELRSTGVPIRAHVFAAILRAPEVESKSTRPSPQAGWGRLVGWLFFFGGGAEERLVVKKTRTSGKIGWMDDGCFVCFFCSSAVQCIWKLGNRCIELMKWRFFLKSSLTQTHGLTHGSWFMFLV